MVRLSLDRIREALSKIDPVFLNSPQYECESLNKELGCRLTLKVETLNPIRCFKGRGVDVALANLREDAYSSVICASAGNLGQALAYCCARRNLNSIVIAAKAANVTKLERMREFGAEVRLVDGDIELAKSVARATAREERVCLIEDSENVDTCEGAATIGLELSESLTPFDIVLVALGAGALATGVGFAVKSISPSTQIVCLQPSGAPAMTLSWRAKHVVTTDSYDTIADGVAGRLPLKPVLDDLIDIADDAVLVCEQSIVRGMQLLYEHAGLVTEPSAALGVAAALENPDGFRESELQPLSVAAT